MNKIVNSSLLSSSVCIRIGLFIAFSFLCLGVKADAITYYYPDIVGTPSIATDEYGTVKWREQFEPYGTRINQPVASFDNDVWFTGKLHDESTGLTYMNARYYHPAIGRFMAIDRVKFTEDKPETFNRYAYANNNPYRYIDPTGNIAESGWDVFNIGMGGVSFAKNVATGNWLGAALDFGGIVLDTGALLTPGVPAGAATGLNAYRAGKFTFDGTKVANKGNVLLDSSVIASLKKNPTLNGKIKPGENPVVSNVTGPELRNSVSNGGNLKGVPRALDSLPVVKPATSVNTRINIRSKLPAGRGRFGDGVIGAQAVEEQLPLITNDKNLGGAVKAAGGVVR